jgi:hypothetical protein
LKSGWSLYFPVRLGSIEKPLGSLLFGGFIVFIVFIFVKITIIYVSPEKRHILHFSEKIPIPAPLSAQV